jgi:tRNA pseudouridine55 synthase
MENILLIDKPKGITSFDVIRRLRRFLQIRKMGHSGTLDPFATGLLLIGVEKGTKELEKLIKLDKEYIADILLGTQTDTGDITGKVLVKQSVSHLEDSQIQKAIEKAKGEHEYLVPKYSAIKVNGKKLYELARAEIDFIPPTKKMNVYEVELLETIRIKEAIILKVRFSVSSGTYIRTLAEEIGKTLGVPATTTELRRTKVGSFKIEDAKTLDSFEEKKEMSGEI